MTEYRTAAIHPERPFLARAIRRLSVPIIVGWLAIAALLTLAVPSLEKVGQEHSVSMTPEEAPSIQAMKRMGKVFGESDSDNAAMIVLEGDRPLGDRAHRYYAALIRKLKADPRHVQHVQDFWSDPLTAAGAQSADGKATYVQLDLAGNQGEALAAESIDAVRDVVARTPPPSGLQVYLTGPSVLIADMHASGDKSLVLITATTVAVIFVVLLLVYRSIVTVVLLLALVGVEFVAARGTVALLAGLGVIGLSTFAINLLTSLGLAAGTDYGIFLLGRYQEARQAGEDREAAYYTTYRGVAHVILGSGLTIAGATYCLSFTRLPYFQSLGIPCAAGMLVAVAAALTLGPAVLTVGSRYRLFDPKRMIKVRGWRRVGAVVTRWPAPVLVATCGVALVGLLALPGYRTSYNDRQYVPGDIPANAGYSAADRHFSQARMKPEIMLVEADHDMRNPSDMLVLNKLAKGVLAVPGVSRVQAITRPDGTTLPHTTLPFMISAQSAGQLQNSPFEKQRMEDLLDQAGELAKMIDVMRRMYGAMSQLAATTHHLTGATRDMRAITAELRDRISDFEDFFRPVRSYFYWERHCYDIPACWSTRSVFDAIDGVDEINDELGDLVADLDNIDVLLPQLLAQIPPMIDSMASMRTMMLTMHSTMSGVIGQLEAGSADTSAMGQAFDASKNDDSFYLPPEVFDNRDFKRGLEMFLSPDGKAARLFILHRGDPATPEGFARVDAIKTAAEEALKTTPLENARISLGGTAAVFKDISDGARYDLMIAAISSLCLIFIIMLVITRSLAAAVVIVGTVALSLGASFGLSVLLWQHIIRMELHWLVLAMSVIILLAVGSDYNLLLVARFKQEIAAGLNTGIIRAVGGTGKVVTNAGLVFAFTMASMAVSELRVLGQVGTTIGLGLLFDTLVVRAFMTPSIAALLGRWFWWPMTVRPRPASALLRPTGPRPAVRALLGERLDQLGHRGDDDQGQHGGPDDVHLAPGR
ncbi:RND family transporter [Mycobacterium malmoense]|uniref:MMPL/RND family transporter n=1 Tax=Mycobacterium malmoense TaxID=1780 RepID=UPI001ABFD7B5|nr:RND family transporter [Mycobacterium malmoense]